MKTIEAVIFDMDGVLVDSEGLWREVREEFAVERGLRWSDADQAQMMGANTATWSQLMVDRLKLNLTAAQTAAEVQARLLSKYQERLPEREGGIAAVYRAAEKYRVGLATGSPRTLAAFVLRESGLDQVFEATLFGDEVPHGKPAPDIYIHILEKMGVAAVNSVGVEDSSNGIRSLHAAGMGIIAAPGPEFPLGPEVLALAHARIDSMLDFSNEIVEAVGARHAGLHR